MASSCSASSSAPFSSVTASQSVTQVVPSVRDDRAVQAAIDALNQDLFGESQQQETPSTKRLKIEPVAQETSSTATVSASTTAAASASTASSASLQTLNATMGLLGTQQSTAIQVFNPRHTVTNQTQKKQITFENVSSDDLIKMMASFLTLKDVSHLKQAAKRFNIPSLHQGVVSVIVRSPDDFRRFARDLPRLSQLVVRCRELPIEEKQSSCQVEESSASASSASSSALGSGASSNVSEEDAVSPKRPFDWECGQRPSNLQRLEGFKYRTIPGKPIGGDVVIVVSPRLKTLDISKNNAAGTVRIISSDGTPLTRLCTLILCRCIRSIEIPSCVQKIHKEDCCVCIERNSAVDCILPGFKSDKSGFSFCAEYTRVAEKEPEGEQKESGKRKRE